MLCAIYNLHFSLKLVWPQWTDQHTRASVHQLITIHISQPSFVPQFPISCSLTAFQCPRGKIGLKYECSALTDKKSKGLKLNSFSLVELFLLPQLLLVQKGCRSASLGCHPPTGSAHLPLAILYSGFICLARCFVAVIIL